MKRLSREQQKIVIEQWKRATPALAQARDDELRQWRYDPATVNALLDIGAKSPRREDEPNGLVEMQRWFMKAARQQGLLPTVVRETPGDYACASGRAVPVRPEDAGRRVYIVGDAATLNGPNVALFCSVKCPGKLILDTYDLATRLRDEGVTVISGFHSPMEQECLRILLRSPHPVIWCLARGVYRQMPSTPVDCRPAASEGRLVMVTPFPNTVRRITAQTATARNRLVVELASAVVIAHAAPGSRMEVLGREVLAAGKPLYTFDHFANAALIEAGAMSVETLTVSALPRLPHRRTAELI